MKTAREKLFRIQAVLLLVMGLNFSFWCGAKEIYSKWEGVPPPPTKNGALMMTLGDPEFAYRFLATTLQNLGNVGRDMAPLKTYNYERLGKWFFLLHELDPASDHVPMLAAYYFGATKVPKDAAVVADYLRVVGQIPVGEKWRWLAHAAYLAQHKMNNLNLALDFAYKLRKMNEQGVSMPQWARQMPAFLLNVKGDREASRRMMENMLVTERVTDPAEVGFMKAYLIEQLGVDPKEVEALARLREGGTVAK